MNTAFPGFETGRATRDWRGAVLPLLLLAIWTLVSVLGWVNPRLIVPPWQVATSAWEQMGRTEFYVGVVFSLGRDISGFVLGALGGLGLGLLMGVSRWAERLIGPSFHTLRQISLFAWLPLLSSWLDTGELSKLVFIALSVFYPVALGSFEGVRQVARTQVELARVHAFTRRQLLWWVILPAAAPQILSGMRLGLIYAWLATLGAEFLLANHGAGLGNLVFKGRASFHVELILFGLLVIGLIGRGFTALADRAEAHVFAWRRA